MSRPPRPESAPPGRSRSQPARPDPLPRHLAIAWVALTVYGSLYPFSGWQREGIDPFAFLGQPWPRYWTAFDLIANVVVYAPLGFFLTLTLRRLPGGMRAAAVLAVLGSGLLSLGLEALQSWLPNRVASNVDLACNTLGSLLGSLLAVWAGARLGALWRNWRPRLIAPLPHVDLGLTLIGLWLITLLSPDASLLGTGDLRPFFAHLPDLPSLNYTPETYRLAEAAVVCCNSLAIGLFASALCQGRGVAALLVSLLFLAAAVLRSFASFLVGGSDALFAWLTPGVASGLRIGAALLIPGLVFPPLARLVLAALALMLGAILVNLAPSDPYAPFLGFWRQGQYFNFNGLTRGLASLWPFLALPYLILVSRRL